MMQTCFQLHFVEGCWTAMNMLGTLKSNKHTQKHACTKLHHIIT